MVVIPKGTTAPPRPASCCRRLLTSPQTNQARPQTCCGLFCPLLVALGACPVLKCPKRLKTLLGSSFWASQSLLLSQDHNSVPAAVTYQELLEAALPLPLLRHSTTTGPIWSWPVDGLLTHLLTHLSFCAWCHTRRAGSPVLPLPLSPCAARLAAGLPLCVRAVPSRAIWQAPPQQA